MKTRVWGKQSRKRHLGNFSSVHGCWILNWRWNVSDMNVPEEAAQRGQRNKGFPLKVRAQTFSFSTKATKRFASSKRRKPPEESLAWCSRIFVWWSAPPETTRLGPDVIGNPGPLRNLASTFYFHFSPWKMCVCSVPRSCPTLCDPMDCSLPGSSVHGIFQAGILERVAISSFRGSSPPRDRNLVSCISCSGRQILYYCTSWEASLKT